jgi:hypothetical protein
MGQCRADSSAEELLLELASSAWMQRLWTYQESFLATSIIVQLQDSFLELTWSTLPRSALPATVQVVWTSFYPLVSSLRPDQRQEMTRTANLGQVLTALNWRTTSKRGDETLTVAALLDVGPMVLTDTSLEDRMKALLLMVRYMPQDIIFFDVPELSTAPYRWAPATLMARSNALVDPNPDQQHAEYTAQGLCGLQ